MKNLHQYTSGKGRTASEWAEFFGISRSHFVMICNGTAQPGKRLMADIEQKTGGEVPILSWFQSPEHDPKGADDAR